MNNQENLAELPTPMQALLKKSQVNMVAMSLQKAGKELPLTASKVGGFGYLPEHESYPSKADGTPLALLTQINFAEVADAVNLSQLPQPLPESGILQIYIDGTDDLGGLDFDNPFPNETYQVRFWENIALPVNQTALEQAKAELEKLAHDNNNFILPFKAGDEFAMSFKPAMQSCSTHCYEYNQQTADTELSEYDAWSYIEEELGINDPDDILFAYDELANIGGHHLLGYPFFTQQDPREYNEELQQHILLFQIDTDDDVDLMWGDAGVANFFITPNDLKNKDFSRLVYNWDCS